MSTHDATIENRAERYRDSFSGVVQGNCEACGDCDDDREGKCACDHIVDELIGRIVLIDEEEADSDNSKSLTSTVEKLREALALCAGGFEGEGLEIENEWRRSIARNALNGVPLSEYERLEARAALSSIPTPSTEAGTK